MVDCVYARPLELGGSSFSRGPLVIYCHPIRLLPGALPSCCEEGRPAWKEGETGKEKGGGGGSEKLFDQVSVDGKLNQIGLDKAGRKSVVYKPRALLPSNSFPIFFFFFFSSLSVYLVLDYFDDYSFQYFFHFDGKIKMKIVREGVNWENCSGGSSSSSREICICLM